MDYLFDLLDDMRYLLALVCMRVGVFITGLSQIIDKERFHVDVEEK